MRVILGSVLALVCWVAPVWADVVVTKVRVGQTGATTRLVLESTKPLKPRVFALDNPSRIVIDLPALTLKADLSGKDMPTGTHVKKLRSSPYNATTHRLVIDLMRPGAAGWFVLPPTKSMPTHRLVMDINPGKGNTVRQTAAPTDLDDPPVAPVKSKVPEKPIDAEAPLRLKRPSPLATPEDLPAAARDDGKVIIMIDPGHGGVDPGAIGKFKTREKDVTLAVSKILRDIINDIPGYEAHLTRSTDVFVRLGDRVRMAQQKNADLFLSIHADAHDNRLVRGGSIYVLSERASDREAERLAQIANDGDRVAGLDLSHEPDDVRDILIDLSQRETLNQSAQLAKTILDTMNREDDLDMRHQVIKFAGFRVLKAPDIPSALVELAYISNPLDERNLRNPAHQRLLAEMIAKGVKVYVEKLK
jgi:N-acetylmuramoyl-L-alanine amidase